MKKFYIHYIENLGAVLHELCHYTAATFLYGPFSNRLIGIRVSIGEAYKTRLRICNHCRNPQSPILDTLINVKECGVNSKYLDRLAYSIIALAPILFYIIFLSVLFFNHHFVILIISLLGIMSFFPSDMDCNELEKSCKNRYFIKFIKNLSNKNVIFVKWLHKRPHNSS